MRNSTIKITVLAAVLAGSAATLSAFAHESEDQGMMSSEGMHGMGGMMQMMNMMSEMAPEDRKALTEACMNMMQSHGDHPMDGDKEDAS